MFHMTGLQSYKIHKKKFKHVKAWNGARKNENRSMLYSRTGNSGIKHVNDRERGDGKTSRGGFLKPNALALLFPC